MMSLLVSATVYLTLLPFVAALCGSNFGPSGKVECVPIDGYIGKQWATCLTDTYIMAKSNGDHHCIDRTRIYCYYQCMVELYDKNDGFVNSDCSCGSGQTTMMPSTTLPPECFSPTGADCDWYADCLETRFPCSRTGNGYAIEYASKFCNLYTDRYNSFSPEGKKWVDATRKCLQVALVPLLRPWRSPTCAEIRQTAFDSHTPCYLRPEEETTICSLNCLDWAQVFWTIKRGFVDSFVESMKGFVEVTAGCAESVSILGTNCPSTVVQIGLAVVLRNRGRRSVEDFSMDHLAGDVTSQIADDLNWDNDVMEWFAYAANDTDMSDRELNITILLGNKKELGLATGSANSSPKLNLYVVVNDLANAVKSGSKLGGSFTTDEGSATILHMSACLDINCEESRLYVESNGRMIVSGITVWLIMFAGLGWV